VMVHSVIKDSMQVFGGVLSLALVSISLRLGGLGDGYLHVFVWQRRF